MNEVDRQVAELQAQSGEKKKQEYSVEVESEDVAATTEETEIEVPQKESTFETEVVEDTSPEVEEKPKQEEVSTEEEKPKEETKQKYSKSVQKRFDEYAYQLGESRRREEEAIKIAQAIKSERDKIQEELSKLNTGYVGAEGGRIESSMEAAKAKLKKAMDDQDSDAMAAAQLEIGKLGSDQARYEQLKSQQEALANAPKQQKEVEIPKVQSQEPVKDPKAEAWATDNEWFGRDKVMTNVAYAIHEDLVNQGVDPRTDYYYTEIDKRMRDNLPHKFKQDSSVEEPATQQPVQTVAGANRNRGTGRNVVKLSSSEAAIAKRLGLSNEQYASEKLKLQRR
tara:strand:+ start:597 stop:1610 length:1014 start_codon:yes stop_codon:yes gene_type:complete